MVGVLLNHLGIKALIIYNPAPNYLILSQYINYLHHFLGFQQSQINTNCTTTWKFSVIVSHTFEVV